MFRTTETGFQMTFENGVTVSVQWGRGNYATAPHTAEVGAWYEDESGPRDWLDEVQGWQTPDEVAAYIEEVRNL